ncbi:MAG: thioredoxin [Deltaproteobacteria bacterium]|nr:thioredoxin [Deltaproteobacteria bacterium]
MASKHITILTDQDFETQVINSDKPVLVDFYADWCGPCKSIAPFLETLAEKYHDQVKIAKINVDQHQLYAGKFGVRSIPTMILFKDGKGVETTVGADPQKIQSMVQGAA